MVVEGFGLRKGGVRLPGQVGRRLSELLRDPGLRWRSVGSGGTTVWGVETFQNAAGDFNAAAVELIAVRGPGLAEACASSALHRLEGTPCSTQGALWCRSNISHVIAKLAHSID